MLIAIIPARGNSQGIKKKNIQTIGGKSLVSLAVNLAIASSKIDLTVLSTDDHEIVANSELFERYQDVFANMTDGEFRKLDSSLAMHKRKPEHAISNSRTIDAITDVILKMDCEGDDLILLLQPTSPFREAHEIRQILDVYKNQNIDAVISARLFDSPHPAKAIEIEGNQLIYKEDTIKNLSSPRQELPTYYVFDGAYYLAKAEFLLSQKSFVSRKTSVFIRDGISTINIDNETDLELARIAAQNI